MKSVLFFLLLLSAPAWSTSLDDKPLDELVAMADHIVEVKIVNVDMVDWTGKPVLDEEETTGPGSANQIRLHAKRVSVIKSNAADVPELIVVDLWRLWNYSLKQVREVSLNEKAVFLLTGKEFIPVYPGLFRRGMHELRDIRILLNKQELHKAFTSKSD